MKTILTNSALGVFLLITLLIGIFINGLRPISAPQLIQIPTSVDIQKGAGFNEITNLLISKGLIRSGLTFKLYAIFSGKAGYLKSGRYAFNSPISIPSLIKILGEGPAEISAVIFPGMTLKEIDERLASLGVIDRWDLINYNLAKGFNNLEADYFFVKKAISLEGYLLPDTYRFYPNSDAETTVKKILNNFKEKVLPLVQETGRAIDKNDKMPKILILASYLEKEVIDASEREIVAGIFEKRLKVGMPLQIDATIIYAKCLGEFLNCPALKKSDYAIDSPYNTYRYFGLTPTPIANPSLESIKAVLNKKSSSYWYYLSDPKTKKTIFSEDFNEHNRNSAKYLLNK